MGDSIVIAPRFNGPAHSGNGGYVCGLLAKFIDGPSEIALRAPPPLDTALLLRREGDSVSLELDDSVLAEAKPAPTFSLAAPSAPSIDEARAAEKRYAGLTSHRYPTCFVCGPGRPQHDGLAIYTGALDHGHLVAATWAPGADLAGDDGRVAPEFIHAALDCPSYWALPRAGAMAALLARMTASLDAPLPPIGETLIVAAWPLSSEGRKHRGASAVYRADGRVIARAEALWIEPRGA